MFFEKKIFKCYAENVITLEGLKEKVLPDQFYSECFFKLDTECTVVFYMNYKHELNAKTFNNKGEILHQKLNFLHGPLLDSFLVTQFKSGFAFYLNRINSSDAQIETCYSIVFYDADLNYIEHVNIDLEVKILFTNNRFLFCFDDFGKLSVFGRNLERFDKECARNLYENVSDANANEKYLFLSYKTDDQHTSSTLEIIEIETGEIFKTIKIRFFCCFKLISAEWGQFLVLYNSQSLKLYVYDQLIDFRLVEELDLSSALEKGGRYEMIRDKSESISFISSNNFKFLTNIILI